MFKIRLFKITKSLFVAAILSIFVGCGGGGSTISDIATAQEIAVAKIMAYAESGSNPEPTLQDYLDAGVNGVTSGNLVELNAVVEGLEADDVNSTEELEALTTQLGINIVPTVSAGTDKTVQVNQSIIVTGSGADIDGSIASYQWTKGSTVLATTASFSYTPTAVGTDTLTLTVTDNDGASATDSMDVIVTAVTNVTNVAPTANAGTNQTVEVNQSIIITGSGADSDGNIASYLWTRGTTDLVTTPSFSYTPTAVGTDTLTLTVTDNEGAPATDSIDVIVTAANVAPTVNAGTNQTTEVNLRLTIEGSGTDSDGNIASYLWTRGTTDLATTASFSYNPAAVGTDTLTLTVTDNEGATATDSMDVVVTEVIVTTIVKDGTVVSTAALVALGENLYTDTNLSVPTGQSCASCHDLSTGFDDPDSNDPTSLGADGSSFGTRNSPTASYAAHIPEPAGTIENPTGGQFLDGRADNLEEQAKGPFLNPVEMANTSEAEVIAKLINRPYAADFEALFGASILSDVDSSYDYIADAIAAFERTTAFSPFNSRFDQGTLNAQELRGEVLFNGSKADCSACHASPVGTPEVFSDFTFFNLGVPRNLTLLNNIGNQSFVDLGLGGVTDNPLDDGKFRVTSLRNVGNTAPYMHNGVFKTLTEVVEFYNTRDIDNVIPEVADNVDDGANIGELGLTTEEIADIVAFMNALSDQ